MIPSTEFLEWVSHFPQSAVRQQGIGPALSGSPLSGRQASQVDQSVVVCRLSCPLVVDYSYHSSYSSVVDYLQLKKCDFRRSKLQRKDSVLPLRYQISDVVGPIREDRSIDSGSETKYPLEALKLAYLRVVDIRIEQGTLC